VAHKISETRHHWTNRLTFLLATVGFSVGLGNIWRFPYITGESGGGAFVVVYLGCILLIGLPLVMAEMMMGRRGQASPWQTMIRLAGEAGASAKWGWLGAFTMMTAFLITSYYAVIGGWTLDYTARALSGAFVGSDGAHSVTVFESLLADPWRMMAGHAVFLALVGVVVSRGLKGGIEKAVNVVMPLLFGLVVLLALYALWAGDAAAGLDFLFTPDFSKIGFSTVLAAVGQAFFSVGVAMAAMMMYGAYLGPDAEIGSSALVVCLADTGVAVIAGIAIFPLVFAFGLEPSGGPGLVFQTLPAAFGQMTGGWFFAPLFFLALVCAAFTSCIAITEPWVAWIEEHGLMSRQKAVVAIILLLWGIGLLTVFSFSGLKSLTVFGLTIFGFLDFLTNSIMLPVGGLLIALFAGWVMRPLTVAREFNLEPAGLSFRLWRILVRYVAPPVILALIILGVGE